MKTVGVGAEIDSIDNVDTLRATIESLKAENESLKTEIENLKAENESPKIGKKIEK
jgi:hypothetical protein|nr:MAG TPA: hypothetical protein [Caudoviricetes sp.]